MKLTTFLAVFLLLFTTAFSQKAKQRNNPPARLFTIGSIETLDSKMLGERRTLNIYLPDDYRPEDTAKYAVIYLLDGSADEDFIHVSGIVQFYSFPWIARIPRSIVVGIATVDRRRDFTFPTTIPGDRERYPTTGHSDKFIRFIAEELQPYIEKKYRTTASKTIIGQSLGGLVATEILFKNPRLFDHYIIISPSLWWDNGSLLGISPELLKVSDQQTHVYIGVGKEGLTPTLVPRVMEADANLLAEKIRGLSNPGIAVSFDYLPGEDHATVSHQAILNAFKLMYH